MGKPAPVRQGAIFNSKDEIVEASFIVLRRF
jgi:hypothetical protein